MKKNNQNQNCSDIEVTCNCKSQQPAIMFGGLIDFSDSRLDVSEDSILSMSFRSGLGFSIEVISLIRLHV